MRSELMCSLRGLLLFTKTSLASLPFHDDNAMPNTGHWIWNSPLKSARTYWWRSDDYRPYSQRGTERWRRLKRSEIARSRNGRSYWQLSDQQRPVSVSCQSSRVRLSTDTKNGTRRKTGISRYPSKRSVLPTPTPPTNCPKLRSNRLG